MSIINNDYKQSNESTNKHKSCKETSTHDYWLSYQNRINNKKWKRVFQNAAFCVGFWYELKCFAELRHYPTTLMRIETLANPLRRLYFILVIRARAPSGACDLAGVMGRHF